MNEYPAGVISAHGIDVPIKVTDSGRWEAEINGRTWSYETRDKLEASLKRQTKQATSKVAVPVVKMDVRWGNASWVRGTLTGIHGEGDVAHRLDAFATARRKDFSEFVRVDDRHRGSLSRLRGGPFMQS